MYHSQAYILQNKKEKKKKKEEKKVNHDNAYIYVRTPFPSILNMNTRQKTRNYETDACRLNKTLASNNNKCDEESNDAK